MPAETIMANSSQLEPTVTIEPSKARNAQPPQAKRVGRACDYCRLKRLKCTATEGPCMNCQLYHAECVYTQKAGTRSTAQQRRVPLNKRRSRLPSRSSTSQVGMVGVFPGLSDLEEIQPRQSSTPPLQESRASYDDHPLQGNDVQAVNSVELAVTESCSYFAGEFAMAEGMPLDFWNTNEQFPGGILFENIGDMRPFLQAPSIDPGHLRATSAFQQDAPGSYAYSSPAKRSTAGSSRDGKVSGIESLAQKELATSHQGWISPGLFIRKDAENSKFIGVNSTGATISFCLKASADSRHGISGSEALGYLLDAGTHVDEAGVSSKVNLSLRMLPEKLIASQSINSYFENVHKFYPIIDQQSFETQWRQFYTHERSKLNPTDYSRFYLIVAIGALSESPSREQTVHVENSSRILYQEAWALFNDVIAAPYESAVQVCLLHVIFHLYFGKGGIAWVFCGLAVRIAQSIGLHRRSPRDLDFTYERILLRSLLWQVAYSLDAFVSATQGRPTATFDSTCDVDIVPTILHGHAGQTSTVRKSDVYAWKYKLAQIQNRFCDALNKHGTIATRLDALGELDTALIYWRDSVPLQFRPEQEYCAEKEMYLVVALLHLEYFNMLRAVHWASLVLVQAQEDSELSHRNPRIRASEGICVGAARSFVRTLNDIASQAEPMKAFPISFQADHYMTALAVLYRQIFRYPQRLSARTDLEYFRAGKVHFERAIHANYFSEALKHLFVEMLRSVEDLLAQSSPMATT